MFVNKGVILAAVLGIGGATLAHGYGALTKQRSIVVEGLAEAIAHRFADPKSLGELGQLIFRQKQKFITLASANHFESISEYVVANARESSEIFTYLLDKDVLGELTDEEARRLFIGAKQGDSAIADLRAFTYDTYSDDINVSEYIRDSWANSTAELDKIKMMMAIEDADARRRAVADYLAKSQQEVVMNFLKPLDELAEQLYMPAPYSVIMQSAIKELYLDTLDSEELENLAIILGLVELEKEAAYLVLQEILLPVTNMYKREKIGELINILTQTASQKQAAEQ